MTAARVLFVDDDTNLLAAFRRQFRNDYTLEELIQVCQGPQPPVIACKGYQKIKQLWKITPNGDPVATRLATQFLKSATDDSSPFSQLEFALRDPGINPGTGFPLDKFGKPVQSLTWSCGQLGIRPLQLWVRDVEGNASSCPTSVVVIDGTKLCMDSLVQQPPVEFRGENDPDDAFAVFQNQPNPFSEMTEIPFHLPVDGLVQLRVFDELGRLVFEKNETFEAGDRPFLLKKSDFGPVTDLGFYQILTSGNAAARRISIEH